MTHGFPHYFFIIPISNTSSIIDFPMLSTWKVTKVLGVCVGQVGFSLLLPPLRPDIGSHSQRESELSVCCQNGPLQSRESHINTYLAFWEGALPF